MITPENINAARRLLSTWSAVNAARIAGDRKTYLAWLREAKPIAGFDPRSRPVGGLVIRNLDEQVRRFDRVAAHVATAKPQAEIPDIGGDPMPSAQSDALPTPPPVITLHLPPYARKRATEFLAADTEAHLRAMRSKYTETVRILREHEADLRAKAKRNAAWVLDDAVIRLLDIAAHLDQAADLIETHVAPDEDNG
jgi:hypothetical protein